MINKLSQLTGEIRVLAPEKYCFPFRLKLKPIRKFTENLLLRAEYAKTFKKTKQP